MSELINVSESFHALNLHPNLGKALDICQYTKPTPIQAKAIPQILAGKDVAASAQTGTGKTAAFVLPALNKLLQVEGGKRSGKPRILILTPTRELATQITKAASLYGKFCQYNIISLLGGMPYGNQIKDLARGADIIVATPGRLMDHMEQKRVDLSCIEMLILDEADRMLDMGFIDDVQFISKFTPAARQTLLFSATLDNKLMSQVRHLLNNPVRIDLSHEKLAAPLIKQEMYRAQNLQHKNRLLKHFLNDNAIYKAIIFSATKINADKLADQLRYDGFAAAALHGDLRQNVRNRTIDQLRRGKVQFLVATDVAARGIDISDITHVINYDMPRFCEDYVHRIGRTGRAGKTGTAISFVLPTEMKHLQQVERYIGQRLNLQMISNSDLETLLANAPKREFVVNDEPEEENFGRDRRAKRSFNSSFDRDKDKARAGFSKRREDKFGGRDDNDSGVTKKPRYDHENEYRSANFSKEHKPKRQFESFDRDGASTERKPKREFGASFDRDARPPRREGFKRDDASSQGDRPRRSFNSSDDRKPRSSFRRDDASTGGYVRRSFEGNDSAERGERKSFGGRSDRAPSAGRDRSDRPFASRDSRDSRDARPSRDSREERRPFAGRDSRDDRRPFAGRDSTRGEKRPFAGRDSAGRGEKKSFGDRDGRSDRAPSAGRDRSDRPFASRDSKEGRFAKKKFGADKTQRFVANEPFGKDKKLKKRDDRKA